ncbi:ABC transporter substrate-binding protein [Microbacterium caowuchunii]|nr:ABC transporter substrate-binding protein [Microbacterium caowuchunii]
MSPIARKLGLAAASFVAAAALLTGCAGPADEATAGQDGYGSLDIQLSFVKNTQNAGEYMADSRGYYSEEGFAPVTLVAGPTAIEAAIATGSADIGFSSVLGSATAITAEEMPIAIIGAIYAKNAFTVMSMAGANAIETPADLEGKRIGVTAGTAQLMVEALAEANGVDPGTITFVPAEGNTALLTGGDVDGYFGLETNEFIVLTQAGHDVVSLPLATNGLPLAGTSFAVSRDAIANQREELKAFLRAEIRGWMDAIADPEAGARLALDVYGADLGLTEAKELAQAEAQIPHILTDQARKTGLFLLSPLQIEENIAALTLAGFDIDADDLFDMSLLEEIYAEEPDLAVAP